MPRSNGAFAGFPFLLAAGTFAVSSALAVLLRGLAGDEEVAHYLIARYAPVQPELFLSLTGRPLVTLALTIPSQLGPLGARLMGGLATAAAAYAVARGALRGGWGPPAIAVLFFLLQPFLLAHAATAMTEPFTAALVAWSVVAYAERRWLLFALLVGLLPPARFELMAVLPVAALVLARERAWRALGVLVLPAFAWNAIGGIVTGDPFYLIHLADPRPYARREALHYVKSLAWIVGLGLATPLVAGLALAARGAVPQRASRKTRAKKRDDHGERLLAGSAAAFVIFLAIYSYLAWWKPVTLGNLRYLAFVAAPLAWLAAAGVKEIAGARSRRVAASLGAAIVVALLLWNHPLRDDYEITKNLTFFPALAALAWIAFHALPKRPAWGAFALAVGLSLATLASRGTTLHLSPLPEEAAMARAAKTLEGFPVGKIPIHQSHPLLSYHLGGNPYDARVYPSPPAELPTAAAPGTFWFWDSHYTGREGTYFEIGYLIGQCGWRYLGGATAADTTFTAGWIVKGTAPLPEGVTVRPSMPEADWTYLALLAELRIASSLKAVREDPKSDLRWRELRFKLNRLSTMGRTKEALGFLDLEATRESGKAEDRSLRAVFLERLERYDEALIEARKALELDPAKPFHTFLLAQLAWSLGEKEPAGRILLQAATALPQNAELQFMAGEVLRDRGSWRGAEAKYLEAIRLNATYLKAHRRAAECARRLGNPEAAEARYLQAIRLGPSEASGYLSLGEFYLEEERPEEALAVWKDGYARTGHDSLATRVGR